MSDEYTREDLDQDTEFARDRWEARTGKDGSFDRWLAEVQAAAWDEGAYAESCNRSQVENMRAGFVDVGTFELLCKRNPYR